MSQGWSAVPPPGVARVTSLGNRNGKPRDDDADFAKPMRPPPLKANTNTTSTQPSRKRKSRFSDAPPSRLAPPPITLEAIPALTPSQNKLMIGANENKAALVSAAAAAAARINASLLAQGKIKSLPQPSLTSPSTAHTVSNSPDTVNPVLSAEIKRVDDMYTTEVDINDIPGGCRNYLTRLSTQENINKICSAYVSTRGKFMIPEEKKQHPLLMGGDKPLYLFVQSQSEANVKKALDRIKQIINNHYEKKSKFQSEALAQIASLNQKVPNVPNAGVTNPVPHAFTPGYPLIPTTTAPLPHCQPGLPSGNFIQEKLFIWLDNVPEHFDLRNKLLGPNYRNFNFIANQTGAKVILRGKGSGFIEPTSGREAFESMHAFISHPNQAGVEAAKTLVSNLIETVKGELAPLMKTTMAQNTQPVGFNYVQSNYEMVPPPPMPVPCPSTSSAPVTAYPFQQITMPTMPVPGPASNSYQNNYGDDTNVLGYQHNFAGTDYHSRSDSSSRKNAKSRKRFTENMQMQPPPTNPSSLERGVPNQDGDVEPGLNTRNSSLPFWMTP